MSNRSVILLGGRTTVVSSQCACTWNPCSFNSISSGSSVMMNSKGVMGSPCLMLERIKNPRESQLLVMTCPCVASQTPRKSSF